jgi:hypothetical protein
MGFGAAFGGGFRPAFDAGGAIAWYRAGGAPLPIVAYQPKGAASLVASYVNLANPGTYNAAPGTAPTLGAYGWDFLIANSQWLTTGYTPGAVGTTLICLQNWESYSYRTAVHAAASGAGFMYIGQGASTTKWSYRAGSTYAEGTNANTGKHVLGLTAANGYLDGVADGAVSGWSNAGMTALQIGALSGSARFATMTVIAFVHWSTTLADATIATVSAAMAAL